MSPEAMTKFTFSSRFRLQTLDAQRTLNSHLHLTWHFLSICKRQNKMSQQVNGVLHDITEGYLCTVAICTLNCIQASILCNKKGTFENRRPSRVSAVMTSNLQKQSKPNTKFSPHSLYNLTRNQTGTPRDMFRCLLSAHSG